MQDVSAWQKTGEWYDTNDPNNPNNRPPNKDETFVGIVLIVLVVLAAMFLMPAILVLWPFQASFGDAFSVAVHSLWAWLGSAVFWCVVWRLVYVKRKNRPTASPRAQGRRFNCWNCGQAVLEMTLGDLERTGVVCPYCQAKNVLQQS
jgi:DNA-directed RNA polymerase subunit RPC12/RpoP